MNYPALIAAICDAHAQAQAGAAGAVNRHHLLRNWLIGAYLVEFEQHGEDRASYGTGLLKRISADLGRQGIVGTSADTLERMRLFFHAYPALQAQISATASRKFPIALPVADLPISATPVRKSSDRIPIPLEAPVLLRFSWSHFVEFIRLDNPWKRAFYENECLKGNWSVRQLQRQIGSLLYERTGLSTDKQAVIDHARDQASESPMRIADLIFESRSEKLRRLPAIA